MDKDKLRTADIFSGGLIFLAGLYIISKALQMPMKDSWGGVQNVWYVSPAIFPLFVGAMIAILGALLVRTAVKEVGVKAVKRLFNFLFSPDFILFIRLEKNIRFYAIVTMLFSFVFLLTPRIDFFLGAIEFLLICILAFYLDDKVLLKKFFLFFLAQIILFILFIVTGLETILKTYSEYPGDYLVLFFIVTLAVFGFMISRKDDQLKKRFKISLAVAVISPLLIGIIFKYLLLVPMPFEGVVVELLDFIWYY